MGSSPHSPRRRHKLLRLLKMWRSTHRVHDHVGLEEAHIHGRSKMFAPKP
ncbi:unnamed protein product [Periconia digitata]|uniref:Uncharacterized protein n=1 Tax=Periconia digitata TaxID=1303443 RepID=A0A9W4UAW6_9PLEO|nr:unnamed protein product [Periconia digitata]